MSYCVMETGNVNNPFFCFSKITVLFSSPTVYYQHQKCPLERVIELQLEAKSINRLKGQFQK